MAGHSDLVSVRIPVFKFISVTLFFYTGITSIMMHTLHIMLFAFHSWLIQGCLDEAIITLSVVCSCMVT